MKDNYFARGNKSGNKESGRICNVFDLLAFILDCAEARGIIVSSIDYTFYLQHATR